MFTKAVLISVFILLCVALLIYMSIKADQTNVSQEIVVQSQPIQTQNPTNKKTATLSFSVPALNLSPNDKTPYSLDLILDSGDSSISGVQAEIKYDSSVLSIAKITPVIDSFFGPNANILINDIDPINGAAVFAIGIPPGGTAKNGSGKIATITFNVLSTTSPSTEMRLLDTSIVTRLGEKNSILKGTTGTIINIPSGLKVFVNSPATPSISSFTPTSTPAE